MDIKQNIAPVTSTLSRRVPPWLIFLSSAICGTLLALHTIMGFPVFSMLLNRQPVFAASESTLCTTPAVRQEWRTLNNHQKLEYIAAVQCLHRIPSISHLQGAKTRFDDFVALHVVSTDAVHNVGHFLPWHRRFLNVYETALRNECGFKGALPYWDWSLDVASGRPLAESPVFDRVFGFGGNGADIDGYEGSFGNKSMLASAGWVAPGSGGGCVTDGPFAQFMLSVGPGYDITDHCMTRAINDNMQPFLTPALVAALMPLTTFEEFRIELEGTPVTETLRVHDAGHNAVDGEMGDRYSSPGDPLFYLHHAFLDKIWWDWVQMDYSSRVKDISGRSTVNPPHVDVTLDFELDMGMLAPPVTIREVMDVPNQLLCHTYE
ncbi:Tyrosinase central domain-containing protein [Mycena sanguinolenta]|uniref:Tyrosinase central domain-containing protein n=1 Tax=Mycena sanguinolenta TaxID=230812 RepID=A0A8H7D4T6_9AGAR|nr:Tyrosinase central domain-containing protein [Mycena sanguinolenta]